MGTVASRVMSPVCNSCSQRKAGMMLHSVSKGLASPDALQEASPRQLSESGGQPGGTLGAHRQGLALAEPASAPLLSGAVFSVRVSDFPQADASFCILQGEPPHPVLTAFRKWYGYRSQRLLLCPALETPFAADGAAARDAVADLVLASCAPVGGRERCAELDICRRDGSVWGVLVSKGDGVYSLFQDKKNLALMLFEDKASGRLLAMAQDEPVALACNPSKSNDLLEVGIKPDVDPVLILTCIFGLLVFDLGPAVLPIPVM